MNPANEHRWFWRVRPRPAAELRLFCFHYSGADASVFAGWQEAFPGSIEIWPVQLPGRADRLREEPFRRMPDVIAALSAAMLPRIDRPFALFGHSLGALIAFEAARFLRRNRLLRPRHLFVSGHPAPGAPFPDRPFYGLPDEEFVRELRRLGGTPEAVLSNPELREIFLPILRADFELSETYRSTPGDRLDCPLSAYGGLQDPFVTRSDLEHWNAQTTGSFVTRMFPGNHFYLNSARSRLVEVLASELCSRPARSYSISDSGDHHVQR